MRAELAHYIVVLFALGVHISPVSAQPDTCGNYMRARGVVLTLNGPKGPTGGNRRFSNLTQAAATIETELRSSCPSSSAAHVHRASLLRLLGKTAEAQNALELALEINRDWTAGDKQTAQSLLDSLRVRPPSGDHIREAAAFSLDGTIDIPGVTMDMPVPQSGVGQWLPWLGGFGGLIGVGLGVGINICYESGCFTPMVTPTNIAWNPTPAPPASKPTMNLRNVIRIIPPRSGATGSTLNVSLFAALDLPPAESLVVFKPVGPVSSCDQFSTLIPASGRLGETTITFGDVKPNGRMTSTSSKTCIAFDGWAAFSYSISSTCIPFIPLNPKGPNCAKIASQMNEACARHEGQHVRDLRSALGPNGPNLNVTECIDGSPSSSVQDTLVKMWTSKVQAALSKMVDDAKDALHQTANGMPISLNSVICQSCFSDVITLDSPRIFASTNNDVANNAGVAVVTGLLRAAGSPPNLTESPSDGPGMARHR
jgi:hypothetical protein